MRVVVVVPEAHGRLPWFGNGTWMSRSKLGSMVSKWRITSLEMGDIGVITHLLTLEDGRLITISHG